MPSIQRRAFLGVLATASTLTGCLSTPDTAMTESSPSTDTASTTPRERVRIEIHNGDAAATTVDLRLTGAGETLLDRQVTVPADGREAVDSGIEEAGEYELDAFVVGGPDLAAEFTIPIDSYDLRQGSNVILAVDGERIGMRMEE